MSETRLAVEVETGADRISPSTKLREVKDATGAVLYDAQGRVWRVGFAGEGILVTCDKNLVVRPQGGSTVILTGEPS